MPTSPPDVWLALTKIASRLIDDLRAERQPIDPHDVADAALSAYRDVPRIDEYRARLEDFVRDRS